MNVLHPKISIPVLIAATVLVISQPGFATTFALDVTNMKGVTQIGSVTTTQVGKDVKVTITLDSGYLLKTDDGYVMLNTVGGLRLTKASLDGFSVSDLTDKLSHATTIGGFTFTDIFRIDVDVHNKSEHSSPVKKDKKKKDHDDKVADKDDDDKIKAAHPRHHDRDRDKENQISLSSLTFTILNANVNQLNGFGLQFCVADENRCGKTGFAQTSVPAVPEPRTLALVGTGLIGLAAIARRRENKKRNRRGSQYQGRCDLDHTRYVAERTVFTR